MQLYDSQLLKGDATDQLWQVFIHTGNYQALADYLINLTESQLDMRGLEPVLRTYLENDPENPLLLRAIGLMFWTRGEFENADKLLRSAAVYLENDPLGRFAWAESRLALGLEINADEIMGSVTHDQLNFNTQEARRLYLLSLLHEKNGKLTAAISALESSVQLNPYDPDAWPLLEKVKRQIGDLKGASQAGKHGGELIDSLTNFKKALVTFRTTGRSSEQLQEMIKLARTWNLDHVAIALEILDLPTSSSVRNQELQLRFGKRSIGPDRFFQSRPKLRRTAWDMSHWNWLQQPSSQNLVAQSKIRFNEIPAKNSGLNYVYKSQESAGQLKVADVMGGGVAVLDFNKDGLMDLYFPGSCAFEDINNRQKNGSSRLYKNLGNFKFEDVTIKSGTGGYGYLMGVAVGDFNNDTWPDLFVTGYGTTILYKNRGDGTFEDVTDLAGVRSSLWTTAAAFADLDEDGDQDLVAVTYVDAPLNQPETCFDNLDKPIHCSPGKFSAQTDLLWENIGNGKFHDISEVSGIAAAANGRGLGLAVADLDDDGRLDLFIANDASPNFYFHQNAPLKFHEMAAESGLAVDGSGKATASMGVVADDLDDDGLLDIFHTNFLNEPNTFRKNLGQGLFHDSTFASGLSASSLARTGFGTVAFDADLDGNTDLFITNGHLDNQPHINNFMQQLPLFYRGLGKKGFQLINIDTFAYLARPVVGRGMVASDFNNDGLIDILIVHRDQPVALLANQSTSNHLWLGLELQSVNGGPVPVGTVIEVQTNIRLEKRWVTAGTGYLSASDPRFVFAVDPSEKLESIKIQWPAVNQRTEELQSVPIPKMNAYQTVRRP